MRTDMQILDPSALEALRGLRDDSDDDLLGELIDLFLADTPGRMAAIRDAIAREDWAALASSAHGLKGSCGSLGALHMADLCARLERLGRGGGVRQEAERIVRELEAQYALVTDALAHERTPAP